MPLLIILALLLGGGGLTVAANNATPLDLLYPIKVHVTDTIRELIIFSDEPKREFQIERALKRLEEAETLAYQGLFTAQAEQAVASSFDSDIGTVKQTLEKLRSEDNLPVAAEVSAHFESTLDAHMRILLQLALANAGQENDIRSLVSAVSDQARQIDSTRVDVITTIMSSGDQELKITSEQALQSAQTLKQDALQLIHDNSSVFSDDIAGKAQAKITTSDGLVAQGQAFYAASNFGAAYIYYQNAYSIIDETKRIMSVNKDLSISVDPYTELSQPSTIDTTPAPTESQTPSTPELPPPPPPPTDQNNNGDRAAQPADVSAPLDTSVPMPPDAPVAP